MILQAVLFCTLVCGALSIDEKSKNLLLKLHNEHRADEGASNMNQLVWDDQLEKEAAQWADGCAFEHQMKKRGENLAFDTKEVPETELIESSFKSWFDEKDLYTYGQHSCGASCHYTQLVWWATRRVGCATKRCGHLANSGATNAWYIVCFYDPKGNMNGETPYKKGSACAECRDDQTCEQGLCKGGADPCEDLDDNCDMWANTMSQCTQNKPFMESKCALSCKFCKGGNGGGNGGNGGGNGGDKGGSNGGDKEEACEDKNEGCSRWAKSKQCDKNPAYMLKNCKKSCNKCKGGSSGADKGGDNEGNGDNKKPDTDNKKPDSGECVDKNKSCKRWANQRECVRNPGYMKRVCAKSCKTCSDNTECYDANGNCRKWTERGECDKNPRWMHEYCKRSCGQCADNGSNKGGSNGRNKGGNKGGRNKEGRNKGGRKGGSKCKDQHKNCGRWAEQGYCQRRRQYMKGYCPVSCDLC